jgi:hypothetical protein
MNYFTIFILTTLCFYSLALQVNHLQGVTAGTNYYGSSASYSIPSYPQSQTSTMRNYPWTTNSYSTNSSSTPSRYQLTKPWPAPQTNRGYTMTNSSRNYSNYGNYRDNRTTSYNATRPSWKSSNQTRGWSYYPYSTARSGMGANNMTYGNYRNTTLPAYQNRVAPSYSNQFNQNSYQNQWNRPATNQTYGQPLTNTLTSAYQGIQGRQISPSTTQPSTQSSWNFSQIPQWISGIGTGLANSTTSSPFSSPLTIPSTLFSTKS